MTDVENAMKVGIAEALKHEVKLVEKLGPIVTLLWRWHVAKGFIRSLEFPFPKLCLGRDISAFLSAVVNHRTVLLTPAPDSRVGSTSRPRSVIISSTLRRLNEKRKYQRTQVAMISGSKWRPRNMAGRLRFIALP